MGWEGLCGLCFLGKDKYSSREESHCSKTHCSSDHHLVHWELVGMEQWRASSSLLNLLLRDVHKGTGLWWVTGIQPERNRACLQVLVRESFLIQAYLQAVWELHCSSISLFSSEVFTVPLVPLMSFQCPFLFSFSFSCHWTQHWFSWVHGFLHMEGHMDPHKRVRKKRAFPFFVIVKE